MRIALLGPLEVRDDSGGPVGVGGHRLRALLIRLAISPDQVVSADRLVDDLWEDDPPANAANALQSLVSRLRTALGPDGRDQVRSSPTGYRLSGVAVDAVEFAESSRAGRTALAAGDPAGAQRCLREALALWRGPALADVAGSQFAGAPAARLAEQRAAALEDRIDADLALGAGADLVAELEELAAAEPLRERLHGQLMRALCDAGRQAEALAAYDLIRGRLVDELGVDPSPDLQATHLAVLRGEFGAAPRPTPSPAQRPGIPASLSSFVGRTAEVARIEGLLAANRLVSVIGPGGAGKTRLVTEAVRAHENRAGIGIFYVELAPVTDGAEVPHTVLAALGTRDSSLLDRRIPRPPREATSTLLDVLAARSDIVVLDNCEHLIDAAATLVDTLLSGCPNLRILTTSREPLGIVGEVLAAVPPLFVPPDDATPKEAGRAAAVQLFVDRARAGLPDFVLDDGNVRAVIEIVRRLDGLPLAIELAAARLRTLPVGEIAARLSDRFRLLTGGSRTAMPRHRTLRAVVQWSWDLLAEPERLLAERVAVFPAGVTPASVASVCGDVVDRADVPDLLSALVDKSLLQLVADDGPRYRMLETIREYGAERLEAVGQLRAVREAHARHFALLVAEAAPHLIQPDQVRWLRLVRDEHDNILAAMRFLGDADDPPAALDVAINMCWYWMITDSHAEAATWLSWVLQLPHAADSDEIRIARAVHTLNSLAVAGPAGSEPGELDEEIRERIRQAGRQLVDVDTSKWPPMALLLPGMALLADDIEGAEQALDKAHHAEHPWARAAASMFEARIAENQGDVPRTRTAATTALEEFRELGDRWGIVGALGLLGVIQMYDEDLAAAAVTFTEALAVSIELGNVDRTEGLFLTFRIADLHARRGDIEAARAALRDFDQPHERGVIEIDAITAAVEAGLERQCGDLDRAVQVQRRADRRIGNETSYPFAAGHGAAISGAMGAHLDLALGDIAAAARRLTVAYPVGRGTKDLPILSTVGVAIADLAVAVGRFTDAAALLGASARLRGAEDPSQLDIRRIKGAAVAAIGAAAYAAAYDETRAMDMEAASARLDPTDLAAIALGEPAPATTAVAATKSPS